MEDRGAHPRAVSQEAEEGGALPWWRLSSLLARPRLGRGSSQACLIPLLLGMPISLSWGGGRGVLLVAVVGEAQPRNTGRAAPAHSPQPGEHGGGGGRVSLGLPLHLLVSGSGGTAAP